MMRIENWMEVVGKCAHELTEGADRMFERMGGWKQSAATIEGSILSMQKWMREHKYIEVTEEKAKSLTSHVT